MNEDKNVLPADFDGVFRFTNSRATEFRARWNSIEYIFPPLSTTPLIISGESPENIQQIRKKFAKEWAIEEFYKTKKFKTLQDTGKVGTPALYTDSDLAPYIQKCLEPLPLGQVKAEVVEKDNDNKFARDEEGNPVTRILKNNESLLAQGSGSLE